LKKKAPPAVNKDGGKGGGDKDKSNIPPAVMDAIQKEAEEWWQDDSLDFTGTHSRVECNQAVH